MTQRTTGSTKDVIKVLPLNTASQLEEKPKGRPKKLTMPAMPQEVLDGLTPLEQEHYTFFVESIKQDYNITKPSDLVALHMAALEYVNLLRVQAKQLASGEVITAARQHPGVQLRAWLDSMAATRSKRKEAPAQDDEQAQWAAAMKRLSS